MNLLQKYLVLDGRNNTISLDVNSLQRLALQIKCLKQVIEWCDLFQKELSFTYLSS